MLTPTTRFAVFFALSACIFRLITFYGGWLTPKTAQYVIFMHLLFILLAVFIAVRVNQNKEIDEQRKLGDDIKTGFKAGSIYSIITTAFVFVYFKFIDVNYFIFKQQELIAAQLKDPTADPVRVKQGVEDFFSLTNYCSVTLLGLMVVTFIYTVIVILVNRFLLNRFN